MHSHVFFLQAANPFFKLLTMLMEFAGGPPGMPPFASYILQRIWEVNLGADVSVFFSPEFYSSNTVTTVLSTTFFLGNPKLF